jgi:hypothetical protein
LSVNQGGFLCPHGVEDARGDREELPDLIMESLGNPAPFLLFGQYHLGR